MIMRNWLVLPMLLVVFAMLPLQAWSHVTMASQSMSNSISAVTPTPCTGHSAGHLSISAPMPGGGHIACCLVTVPPLFMQSVVLVSPAATPQVGIAVQRFLSFIPSLPVPPPKA